MLIHGLNNQSRSSLMEQIRPEDRILLERKTVRAPITTGAIALYIGVHIDPVRGRVAP